MNPEDEVLVTIRCMAYNHEPYIRQCLDGFVMQKTNFRFEAIVHDDASTDGTAAIIREYAAKYPDIIKPIFQTENQYSKHDGAIKRAFDANTRGKYAAMCEGDDYWTDALKLQKQVDFMESHPECSLYLSNGYGYYEDTGKTVVLNSVPISKSRYLTMSETLREEGGLIPTASMCMRQEMLYSEPEWCLKAPVGDRPLRMWSAVNGKVYYDVTPMVTYRKNSSGSFTQRVTNREYARHILDRMNEFFDKFDEFTQYAYHQDVQYMKDREEYSFYSRIADFKSLVKCDFFKSRPLVERLKMQAKDSLPGFYSVLKGLKDIF